MQSQPENNSSPKETPALLSLPEILLSLADVFRFDMTERALDAYILTVGHRTDADLNAAYRKILRGSNFMPKPGELIDACPEMRVRRDGSKPE